MAIEQESFFPCCSFFSELSILQSTSPAKTFQKVLPNGNTFLIIFGLWEKCFLVVCQTFSGRTVRTAFFESARTISGKMFFFREGFIFYQFRTLSKTKLVSASQISVMLSKMLSMCPQEPLEEKTILIRKNYFFVNVRHWAQKLWLLSENLVRVCQNCIQRSLWNFSRKSLIWTFFSFSDTLRTYSGILPKKWQSRQKCNLRIQRNIWRVVFEETVFSSFSDIEWQFFDLLSTIFREVFKSAIFVYRWSLRGNYFFCKKYIFCSFSDIARTFFVLLEECFVAIVETAFYVSRGSFWVEILFGKKL